MLSRLRKTGFIVLLLIAVSVAGCSDSAPAAECTTDCDTPPVEATETTGGIRGVVVDASISPVVGATVTVKETAATMETDELGNFVFNGLAPGVYTVVATKVLYDTVQSSSTVVAGVKNPEAVKLQLTRLTNLDPYAPTLKFDGYLFCSANVVIILSEECGEGVGVEGVGRVGGNENNVAQVDFYVDSGLAKTIQAEVVWTPSFSVGTSSGRFNMGIYKDFVCDPTCHNAAQYDNKNGGSPLTLRTDDGNQGDQVYFGDDDPFMDVAEFDETTRFSTFTWAASDDTGVLLEQSFEMFVTVSYLLPLPEGWSYVDGDRDPF